MIRYPVVSGQFYPADPFELKRLVLDCLGESQARQAAVGVMVPHAGYAYSGPVAGAVFNLVRIPELVIILGPNHTGRGAGFALAPPGRWQTPLGEVEVPDLSGRGFPGPGSKLRLDSEAHRYEHSIEVQLPFLQVSAGGPLAIVPISIASLELEPILRLGAELADFIGTSGTPALVIASSDLTHYEPDRLVRGKDRYALEAVLSLDPAGLLDRVVEREISMCGAGPAAVMLETARRLGATEARLAAYATSGEVSGDYDSVVGYAGVTVV